MPRTTGFSIAIALFCALLIGTPGAAIRLDGSDIGEKSLLDAAMPEGAIWLQCRFDAPPSFEPIISKVADETNNSEDELFIARRADGRIEFRSKMSGSGAQLVSATVPAIGESVQVGISWGREGRKLFIDGVEEASDTYPTAWGGGTVGECTVGAAADANRLEVFSTARRPDPPSDRARVKLVKTDIPDKARQGDVIEMKFAFSTARPSERRARIEVWLVKNDHTVSRADLSFSVRNWKPGRVHWVGPVKFDLFDAPEGKNVIALKSKHTEMLGLPKDGSVGRIVVKGHR